MKKLIISILIIFFSCASGQQNTSQVEIAVEKLTEGSYGGYADSKEIVINDKKELRKVYAHINRIRKPGIPVPSIDFEKEIVIALFMGEKKSGGYGISVDKIYETKDTIEVFIRHKKPDGIVSMAITQPFFFCKLLRKEKKIVFKKVK